MLYDNALIMYDHQTESLWSHILGQAIGGELKGTQLTFIPALQTDWQTWIDLHPDTLVVNDDSFGRDSYESYYASDSAGVIGAQIPRDGDLYVKEYVLGVRLDGDARAYPFSVLNDEPVVNDRVGDTPVVIFFDEETTSGTAFSRTLDDGRTLNFQAGESARYAIDVETNSEWDIFAGVATSGELVGTQLTQIPITYAFWFGWSNYHPESSVYRGKSS